MKTEAVCSYCGTEPQCQKENQGLPCVNKAPSPATVDVGEAIDLEAIKARAEKATPGPWAKDVGQYPPYPWVVRAPEPVNAMTDVVATVTRYQDDAVFIAHARTDIPALLERASSLASALETAEKKLSSQQEDFTAECGVAHAAELTATDRAHTAEAALETEQAKVNGLEAALQRRGPANWEQLVRDETKRADAAEALALEAGKALASVVSSVRALMQHTNPTNVSEGHGQQWFATLDETDRALATLAKLAEKGLA